MRAAQNIEPTAAAFLTRILSYVCRILNRAPAPAPAPAGAAAPAPSQLEILSQASFLTCFTAATAHL